MTFLSLPATWFMAAMVVLAVIATAKERHVDKWGAVGVIAYGLSYVLSNLWTLADERQMAVRLWEQGLLIIIGMYVTMAFFLVRTLFAKLVFAVLMVAEWFAAFEYLQCRVLAEQMAIDLLNQQWGIEVSKYACGRAFGSLAPWVFPGVTTAVLAWIVLRWKQTRD